MPISMVEARILTTSSTSFSRRTQIKDQQWKKSFNTLLSRNSQEKILTWKSSLNKI